MAYSTTQLPSGLYQVSKDGQVVGTGTKAYADTFANLAPTPAPPAPAVPGQTDQQRTAAYNAVGIDPTIAGSGVRRYGGTPPTGGTYGSEAAAAYGPGGTLNIQKPDEAQIRADAQARVQAQVDAIRNSYVGILAEVNRQNEGRTGRTRATAARSGVLGSDFGNAQLDETAKANQDIYNAKVAERDQQIQTILGAADERAQQRIDKQNELAVQSAEGRLAYYKNVADQSRQDLTTYFKAGGTIDQLSDTQYKQFLDETGLSPEQASALQVLNKPQDTVLTSFTQGNKYYVVTQDPITKARKTESVDLGFTVPAGYNSQKLDDGTIVFYPEKFDPTKPIKDQILTYGVQSDAYKLDKQLKEANLQKTYAEIAKLQREGEDQSVITDLQGAAAAISAGADADKVRQRFLDSHPTKGDLYLKYTKQAY